MRRHALPGSRIAAICFLTKEAHDGRRRPVSDPETDQRYKAVTFAFWCVFITLLLPYVFSILARAGTSKADYVRDPRGFNETLSGWRRRAHLAQLNAFEAFPAFAAAVVIAQIVGAPQAYLDAAAFSFVGFRMLHGVFYLLDRPSLRSASWQAGMLCIVWIFSLAAVAPSPT